MINLFPYFSKHKVSVVRDMVILVQACIAVSVVVDHRQLRPKRIAHNPKGGIEPKFKHRIDRLVFQANA